MAERVLVTGGAGFIGHHLVRRLLASGANVLVVDALELGRRSYLADAPGPGRLRLEQVDLCDESQLGCVTDFDPDIVFHLAALHFIPYCVAHPKETLDANVNATENLVRALRPCRPRTLVFTSSAAVYGFADDPLAESAPQQPVDIYGLSKWLAEAVLRRLHVDRPELRTVIARLFNVYGQCETNPHIVPDLLSRLDDDAEIGIGNLWPKRDYVHVSDVVAALLALADGPAGLEVCNVAGGAGYTVLDVVQTLEVATGRTLPIRHAPERARASDGHLVADLGRIRERYGWSAVHDLKTGFQDLVDNPHAHPAEEADR